jgi:hypothetical protein
LSEINPNAASKDWKDIKISKFKTASKYFDRFCATMAVMASITKHDQR